MSVHDYPTDKQGAFVSESPEALSACPFCGGTDIDLAFALSGDGVKTPGCMTCGAAGPEAKDQSERGRTAAWNRRSLPDGLVGEILTVLRRVADESDCVHSLECNWMGDPNAECNCVAKQVAAILENHKSHPPSGEQAVRVPREQLQRWYSVMHRHAQRGPLTDAACNEMFSLLDAALSGGRNE